MTGPVRHAARAATVASAAAALATMGLPAVAAAAALAALLIAATCWVLGSRDRSDHLTRIILSLRGDTRCLYPHSPNPAHEALPTSTAVPSPSDPFDP